MHRRQFLQTLGAGAAALLARPYRTALGLADGAAAARAQPNFLFVFADDQTFQSIRALNNPEVETPNLDRLVRRGTVFTHCYNMGAWHGAVCVASRTMLNTGLFLWRAQRAEKELKAYRSRRVLWSQLLAGAGYQTYFAGKWHVKVDPATLFDVTGTVRGGMPRQTKAGYDRPKPGQPDPWKPWDPKFGGYWQGGKHWSEVLGDEGVGFLGRAGRSDKPFFMYLAFNAPHDPRQSPKAYVDKYPLKDIAVPRSFLPEYPYPIGSNRIRDEKLAPFPRTKHAVKVHRQEYYAIITHMDAQLGRFLDALDKSGKADSTYVFFTADHGLAVGHHGLMGKQNMFDPSMRAPFIVVGPGVPRGKRIDAPIYLQDVLPTTLELAGADIPRHVQFRSVLPLIRGRRKASYEAIYGGYTKTQRMVTEGDWKLVLYPRIPKTLLFDVRRDPWEMKDLSAEPASRPILRRLFARLRKLQKETSDTLDLVKSFPALAE